jgi:hypothetical protein
VVGRTLCTVCERVAGDEAARSDPATASAIATLCRIVAWQDCAGRAALPPGDPFTGRLVAILRLGLGALASSGVFRATLLNASGALASDLAGVETLYASAYNACCAVFHSAFDAVDIELKRAALTLLQTVGMRCLGLGAASGLGADAPPLRPGFPALLEPRDDDGAGTGSAPGAVLEACLDLIRHVALHDSSAEIRSCAMWAAVALLDTAPRARPPAGAAAAVMALASAATERASCFFDAAAAATRVETLRDASLACDVVSSGGDALFGAAAAEGGACVCAGVFVCAALIALPPADLIDVSDDAADVAAARAALQVSRCAPAPAPVVRWLTLGRAAGRVRGAGRRAVDRRRPVSRRRAVPRDCRVHPRVPRAARACGWDACRGRGGAPRRGRRQERARGDRVAAV